MTSKTFLVVAAMVAILALAGGLLGCGSQAPAASPTSQAAASAPTKAAAPTAASAATAAPAAPTAAQAAPTPAPETLKIGIQTPLSGPAARNGLTAERIERFAIDDVNAKGGVKVGGKTYRLDAVTVDDKGTSEGGRDAANRLLLNEKVKVIIGPFSSPTAGAQTITEPAKALVLSVSATDKSIGANFPHTFVLGYNHQISRAQVLYDFVAKTYPDIKKVAIIMGDDAYGRGATDVAEAQAKSKGMTVVTKEFFPLDTKDFSPLVTRVLRQSPDAIDMSAGSYGPLFVNLMKAIAEQKFKGLTYGITGDATSMASGASYAEGFIATGLVELNSAAVGDKERELNQRFLAKFPASDLEISLFSAYNLPIVLAQAMEKAGTVDDGDKLAQALRAGEFETMWTKQIGKSRVVGAKTFGSPAVLEQMLYLSKVEKGKGITFTGAKSTLP